MSLRFREGNKVALMRGTEGDSESVLLAEYTKTDLYSAADERVKTIVYFLPFSLGSKDGYLYQYQ